MGGCAEWEMGMVVVEEEFSLPKINAILEFLDPTVWSRRRVEQCIRIISHAVIFFISLVVNKRCSTPPPTLSVFEPRRRIVYIKNSFQLYFFGMNQDRISCFPFTTTTPAFSATSAPAPSPFSSFMLSFSSSMTS